MIEAKAKAQMFQALRTIQTRKTLIKAVAKGQAPEALRKSTAQTLVEVPSKR